MKLKKFKLRYLDWRKVDVLIEIDELLEISDMLLERILAEPKPYYASGDGNYQDIKYRGKLYRIVRRQWPSN